MSGDETTPNIGDSVPDDAASVENWEQRFKDTQAAFTKAQQSLKEHEGYWENEDALIARIGEKYSNLLTDESDETPFEDDEFVPADQDPPLHDPRLDDALPILKQLAEAEAERNYQSDLNSLLGDREVSARARKFIRNATAQGGDTHEALEEAVTEWFAEFPEDETPKASRRAPHVPKGGKAVDVGAAPDYSNMTMSERHEAMLERARALEARTQ